MVQCQMHSIAGGIEVWYRFLKKTENENAKVKTQETSSSNNEMKDLDLNN